MGRWLTGVEAVLADGTVVRTGSPAASSTRGSARAPLPDLTGLFVSTQGTTGVVLRGGLALVPKAPHRGPVVRLLLVARRRRTRRCGRWPGRGPFDDVGCMTWPSAKLLFGATRGLVRADDEPLAFLFIDITGSTRRRAGRPRRRWPARSSPTPASTRRSRWRTS